MLFLNFVWREYVLCAVILFFLILMDSIITNINANLYPKYYKLETLPWNKFLYRNLSLTLALILSTVVNLLVFFGVMFFPVKITFLVLFVGFWLYRLLHSILRCVELRRL